MRGLTALAPVDGGGARRWSGGTALPALALVVACSGTGGEASGEGTTGPAAAPAKVSAAPEPPPGVPNRIACFADFVCGVADRATLVCLQVRSRPRWGLEEVPIFGFVSPPEGFEWDGTAADVSLSSHGVALLADDGQLKRPLRSRRPGPLCGAPYRYGHAPPTVTRTVPPPGIARLSVSTAFGAKVACALDAGGAPHCWGPERLPNPAPHYFPPFASLAVADESACGLDALGGVWCWPLGPDDQATPSLGDLFRGEGVRSLTTVGLRDYAALTALGEVLIWRVTAGRIDIVDRRWPSTWIRRLRGGTNLCIESGDDRIRCYHPSGTVQPSELWLETTNVGPDGHPIVDFCSAAGELCRQPRSGPVECQPMDGRRAAEWTEALEPIED